MPKERRVESNIEVSLNRIDRNTLCGERKRMLSMERECRIQARGLERDGHPANSQQLKGLAGSMKQVCLTVKQALPARPGIFPDACVPPRHMEILIKKKSQTTGEVGG